MEDSTNDVSWSDDFTGTTSTDVEAAPSNFELWDPMIFSGSGTLNEALDSQSLENPSIDGTITTSQIDPNFAPSNQEFSYDLDNETISLAHLALQSNTLPLEGSNEDIKKEVKELRDMLVTAKGQVQILRSELYTVKSNQAEQVTVIGELQSKLYTVYSNHAEMIRWTLDMGEALKVLAKRAADHTGTNTVGQDGFDIENLDSWLNPGSGS